MFQFQGKIFARCICFKWLCIIWVCRCAFTSITNRLCIKMFNILAPSPLFLSPQFMIRNCKWLIGFSQLFFIENISLQCSFEYYLVEKQDLNFFGCKHKNKPAILTLRRTFFPFLLFFLFSLGLENHSIYKPYTILYFSVFYQCVQLAMIGGGKRKMNLFSKICPLGPFREAKSLN